MKKQTKVLVIVKNDPFHDSRVLKELRSLLDQGFAVDVIGICRRNKAKKKILGKANFYPIYLSKGSNKLQKMIELAGFSSLSFLRTFSCFLNRKYEIIYLHTPPDFLVFSGLLAKYVFKAKIISDIHDLGPEFYLARYKNKSIFYKLLLRYEKMLVTYSHAVVVTNHEYRKTIIKRNKISPNKVFVVKNYPNVSDSNIFRKTRAINKPKNKKILLYLGALNPQDGLFGMVDSVRMLVNDQEEKEICCWVVGEGEQEKELKEYVKSLGIEDHFKFWGGVWDRNRLASIVNAADICLEPAPANQLNNKSTFIKIFEYMLAGKPIVSYDLKETVVSAKNSSLYAKPNNKEDFAQKILELVNNSAKATSLGSFGSDRSKELIWETEPADNLLSAISGVINSEQQEIGFIKLALVRLLDMIIASLSLFFLSPLFLFITLWIRMDSKGSAMFAQQRIGENQKLFTIYKFRTMMVGAEKHQLDPSELSEPNVQIKDDPRITRVGQILRRYSLDELPQLINVVKGEMSMVGPRPLIKEEVDCFPVAWLKRFKVKPGLTGLAQVSGRSDLSVKQGVKLDLKYLLIASLTSYFKILFKTVIQVLIGKGVV